jgi:hypothetical protein
LVDRYDPIGIPILGHQLLATTGKFIAANYPKGITIVYDQMGQTPWYAGTDKTFIDGAGLTDRDIAHLQLDMQQHPPSVLSLHAYIRDIALRLFNQDVPQKQSLPTVLNGIFNAKPEMIIIMSHHHDNPNHAVMHGLLTDPRLASGYYPAYKVNHFNTFYHRNDMAMPAQDIIPFTTEVQRFDTPATRPEP